MKHGWAFMDALTQAIETWSGDILRAERDAFVYRGADLRHAVERALFFRVANDDALHRHFDALAEGDPAPPALADIWCATIASYMVPEGAAPKLRMLAVPPLPWLKRLRSVAGNLSRLGRRSFRTARLKSGANILFLCIHPKFAIFFAPVADEIGPGAAFLSIDDPAVETYLAGEQMACVALRSAHSRLPRSSVLHHFLYLCAWFDRMADMMDELKPSAIVVPEGNAPIYEIANRAGRQRGIATVCLQHGAFGYSNPGFRNWTFSDALVWGSRFQEPFARANPLQHFTITGTPATLPVAAPRPGDAPVRSIGFFLQKGASMIPEAEWDGMLDFLHWVAAAFPEIPVIVRDHPSSPGLTPAEQAKIGSHPQLRFMQPSRHSLTETLGACDVVVAAASTTLLEAVATGAIPFIFGTTYPDDYPDIEGAGAAICAASLETARELAEKLVRDGDFRAQLRHNGQRLVPELFAATGRDGARAIARAIDAAVQAERGAH